MAYKRFGWAGCRHYLAAGVYATNLRSWIDTFRPEQLMIIQSEHFWKVRMRAAACSVCAINACDVCVCSTLTKCLHKSQRS